MMLQPASFVRRVSVVVFLLYCCVAVVTCSVSYWPVTSELAPLWYVLLFFPKWWVGVLLLAALPGACFVGRYGMVLLFLLFGIQLFCYNGFRLHPFSSPVAGQSFTVTTLNAGEGGLDLHRLDVWLQQHPVDLIAFQELRREESLEHLFPSGEWHVLRREKLTVASRYPLKFVEDLKRSVLFEGEGYGLVFVAFDLEYEGQLIRMMNVHLETPRDGLEPFLHGVYDLDPLRENFRRRSYEARHVEAVAERLQASVLLGDFNMPFESPLFKLCFDGYQDVYAKSGLGFGSTKFTRWHSLCIDHILTGKGVLVGTATVGANLGSDHRPFSTQLAFP